MADIDERLAQARQQLEHAEGFVSDAEFREEHEERTIRYQQATCHLLMGLFTQNEVIIDLLRDRD